MRADADEKIVPYSTVAVGAQRESVRLRNARRTYWPRIPGTRARAPVPVASLTTAASECRRKAQTTGDRSTRSVIWLDEP